MVKIVKIYKALQVERENIKGFPREWADYGPKENKKSDYRLFISNNRLWKTMEFKVLGENLLT